MNPYNYAPSNALYAYIERATHNSNFFFQSLQDVQTKEIIEKIHQCKHLVKQYDEASGLTPLHLALLKGLNYKIIEALIINGADVNAVIKTPNAKVHYTNKFATLKTLYSQRGLTPLHCIIFIAVTYIQNVNTIKFIELAKIFNGQNLSYLWPQLAPVIQGQQNDAPFINISKSILLLTKQTEININTKTLLRCPFNFATNIHGEIPANSTALQIIIKKKLPKASIHLVLPIVEELLKNKNIDLMESLKHAISFNQLEILKTIFNQRPECLYFHEELLMFARNISQSSQENLEEIIGFLESKVCKKTLTFAFCHSNLQPKTNRKNFFAENFAENTLSDKNMIDIVAKYLG